MGKQGKLTRPETVFLDHIAKYGSARGITLGRGRPNDRRVIESLLAKKAIVKYLSDGQDAIQADYGIVGPEDKNGIAIVTQFGDRIDVLRFGCGVSDWWKENAGDESAMSAWQNGHDTAIECGFNPEDSWLFNSVVELFASDTFDLEFES